jgi:hypothetical protein
VTQLDYEPAPLEASYAAARKILADLFDLPPLPIVGEGECDDCRRCQVVLRLGCFEVCRPCAQRRHQAGEKAAA